MITNVMRVDCVWNVVAHAQKPDFVFRRNGRVHLNQQGIQLSRLLAAEVCTSALVILDTPCSEVVWRVLATHSFRQFSLHFPSLRHGVPSHFNWTVLTDDGEADPGITGRRLPEVDTTPVLPFVAFVHVVEGQGGWVSDSEEVSAFIQDLLVFPVRRHLRGLPTDVKAVDKRQCQPQCQDYFCSILFVFKDGSDHIWLWLMEDRQCVFWLLCTWCRYLFITVKAIYHLRNSIM